MDQKKRASVHAGRSAGGHRDGVGRSDRARPGAVEEGEKLMKFGKVEHFTGLRKQNAKHVVNNRD